MEHVHKIIMLGGRRAGKSSILSSILYALDSSHSNLFTVTDRTIYPTADNLNANGVTTRLRDKRNEINSLLKRRAKIGLNANFLVDMTPTKGENKYLLQIKLTSGKVPPESFEFIDVPGETMEDGRNTELKERIKECDVYIIAIDTPYMMQGDNDINIVYNRVEEITAMMTDESLKGDEVNRRLIIFCPVKCEKWVKAGNGHQVAEHVRSTYRQLINSWINDGSFDFLILPIQTVGVIEHSQMYDAYRCYSSESDKTGKLCSVNELTGQVLLPDGTIGNADNFHIEEAPEFKINGLTLPLSWYRVVKNNGEVMPMDSEQPAYQILRFLVGKVLKMNEAKKRVIDSSPMWKRIWSYLMDPPFGQYIEQYRIVVEQLEKSSIKLGMDGFMQVTNLVEL